MNGRKLGTKIHYSARQTGRYRSQWLRLQRGDRLSLTKINENLYHSASSRSVNGFWAVYRDGGLPGGEDPFPPGRGWAPVPPGESGLFSIRFYVGGGVGFRYLYTGSPHHVVVYNEWGSSPASDFYNEYPFPPGSEVVGLVNGDERYEVIRYPQGTYSEPYGSSSGKYLKISSNGAIDFRISWAWKPFAIFRNGEPYTPPNPNPGRPYPGLPIGAPQLPAGLPTPPTPFNIGGLTNPPGTVPNYPPGASGGSGGSGGSDEWRCNCPDYTRKQLATGRYSSEQKDRDWSGSNAGSGSVLGRQQPCKHILAVKALLGERINAQPEDWVEMADWKSYVRKRKLERQKRARLWAERWRNKRRNAAIRYRRSLERVARGGMLNSQERRQRRDLRRRDRRIRWEEQQRRQRERRRQWLETRRRLRQTPTRPAVQERDYNFLERWWRAAIGKTDMYGREMRNGKLVR